MAKMRADDKYQGLCLVNEEGSANMAFYDILDPRVRKMLQNSSVNLCPICFRTLANAEMAEDNSLSNMQACKLAIRKIELAVKCQEVQ